MTAQRNYHPATTCVVTHATAHRSHFSTGQCWASHGKVVTSYYLPWPARSPDLSPIEHLWDHVGWRVGDPTSLNEL
ncbi:hypothetical protein TNCV_2784001 [Trichonephila clavipes]|nr:hypothetical protein TNCV_2784001 [Trichonephila clavipes]